MLAPNLSTLTPFEFLAPPPKYKILSPISAELENNNKKGEKERKKQRREGEERRGEKRRGDERKKKRKKWKEGMREGRKGRKE